MYILYILHVRARIGAYLYSSTVTEGLALVHLHNRSYLLFPHKYLQNIDFTPAVDRGFFTLESSDTRKDVSQRRGRERRAPPLLLGSEVSAKVAAASRQDELAEDVGETQENGALSWQRREVARGEGDGGGISPRSR